MTLIKNLNVGDKFWYADKPFLVIDLQLSQMSLTVQFPEVKCVLDLNSYKVLCFDNNTKVEPVTDNISV